jgi:uncharacterized lipoprotein
MAIAGLTALGACSTTMTLPPYTPVTTAELAGATRVREFKYFPKSKVPDDLIHTTASETLHVTDSVPDYYTNAVRREFRQAGLSLKPESKCKLDGEINDFTIDDIGFSIDWISDVRYILYDANDKPLLDTTYQTKFNTDKVAGGLASVNKMISDNVGQLIADPAFVKALSERCPKP